MGGKPGQTGAIVISLVVGMLLLGAIGATSLYLNTGSEYEMVAANINTEAYYLAESGFRYAARTAAHGTFEDLADLHGRTVSMGPEGSFTLEFTSYWSKTASVAGGTLTSQVDVGLAPDVNTGPGYVLVEGEGALRQYATVTRSGADSDTLVFTAADWAGVSPGQAVYFATKVQSVASVGGESRVTLQPGSGYQAFPEFNGRILVDGDAYYYRRRQGDTFVDIKDSDRVPVLPAWSAGDDVVLSEFLHMASVGRAGTGYFEAERTITYFIPFGEGGGTGDEGPEDISFDDPADLEKFTEFAAGESWGDWNIVEEDGGPSLNAGVNPGVQGGNKQAIIGFYPNYDGTSENPFYNAWTGNNHILSYDIQVKIKNNSDYYMAGLFMRMLSEGGGGGTLDTYGVSFIKTIPASGQGNNKIDDGLSDDFIDFANNPALNNQPAVVFWRRVEGRPNYDLLAYRLIDSSTGVVDATGHLRPWSTLLVRVIEEADLDGDGNPIDSTRKNRIMVFIGDDYTGSSTGDANPFNNARISSPRGGVGTPASLPWPPLEGRDYTAPKDYFTLLHTWVAAVHTGSVGEAPPSFENLTWSGQTGPNTVIVPVDPAMTTTSFSIDRLEVGLHALGSETSIESTFFDDFSINLSASGVGGGGDGGFSAPIQQ